MKTAAFLAKSHAAIPATAYAVIPAKAGIQSFRLPPASPGRTASPPSRG